MRRGKDYWIIITVIAAYFSILGSGIYFYKSPGQLCETTSIDGSQVLVRLSLATAIYNSTHDGKPVVMIWHGSTSTRVAGTIEDLKSKCGMGN
jgi:hypothetical protein